MIYLTGHIEDGVLKFRHRKFVDALLKKQLNGEIQITIEPLKKTRSLRQLRYYWGVIVKSIAEEQGELEPNDVHEFLKLKFNPIVVEIVGKNGIDRTFAKVGGTTTRMNVGDFLEYCEKIKIWAAQDLNIHIPDPAPEEGYYYER